MSQLCGILGIMAAIGMSLSDLVMLARPISGRAFVAAGLNNLAFIPDWRLRTGAVAGVISAALYIPGFWHVYLSLSSGGARAALVTYWLLAGTMIFGSAFHIAHGFVGIAIRREASTAGGSPDALIRIFLPMMRWTIELGALSFVAGSIVFSWLVATGHSNYPNWFAIGSPAIFVAVFALLGWRLPSPWGGYLFPACFNLAMIAFLAASLGLS